MKGGLYYNSFYNPGIIEFTSSNVLSSFTYKSYIIELWYMQDNLFDPTYIYNTLLVNPFFGRNHIFYSNIVQLFLDSTAAPVYTYKSLIYGSSTPVTLDNGSPMIDNFEWNRIIINVVYDPDPLLAPNNYYVDLYTKNRILAANKLNLGSSSSPLLLTKIAFTHNEPSGKYPNIVWGSGYYRNLKLWKGDQISPAAIIQYNNL